MSKALLQLRGIMRNIDVELIRLKQQIEESDNLMNNFTLIKI